MGLLLLSLLFFVVLCCCIVEFLPLLLLLVLLLCRFMLLDCWIFAVLLLCLLVLVLVLLVTLSHIFQSSRKTPVASTGRVRSIFPNPLPSRFLPVPTCLTLCTLYTDPSNHQPGKQTWPFPSHLLLPSFPWHLFL